MAGSPNLRKNLAHEIAIKPSNHSMLFSHFALLSIFFRENLK